MPDAHPRVLHVEDNDFFAKVTANVLDEEYDMEVCTVESAEKGLERLETEQFECIVSDYEMPGMDGLQLLDEVRDSYPQVPFILLTGGGSEQIASKAISAGVTDYLQKGEGREQFTVLANRIENAIARRRTERLSDRQISINDLIWDVSQAVLQTSSREDIERTVCDRLAHSESYVLAWVGKVDDELPVVRPQVSAGVSPCFHDAVFLEADGRTDHEPVRGAVETRSVQVERATTLGDQYELAADSNGEQYSVAAVPLVYEDQLFGVLSVWADARHAFGEAERRLLSKFGTGVAYAIDSVKTRKELVRREQRLQVFNRILRHNLRNDLNVVLGRAENIKEDFPPAAGEAKVIEKKASELIEISEKAREVGKTLDRGRGNQQIDVTECVERTCSEFRQSYPEAEITTDVPESAPVYADKTLEAAISEVLENAIEHNDDQPSVEVTVSVDDEWVELAVLDDGPGIPADEREVLAEGKETSLHHGSGLGLWLANWIVGKFGGELSFDDHRTSGDTVTFRLHRPVDDVASPDDVSTFEAGKGPE